MNIHELKVLKTSITKLYSSDFFGMGETEEQEHIKKAIEVVHSIIVNEEE